MLRKDGSCLQLTRIRHRGRARSVIIVRSCTQEEGKLMIAGEGGPPPPDQRACDGGELLGPVDMILQCTLVQA